MKYYLNINANESTEKGDCYNCYEITSIIYRIFRNLKECERKL